MRKVKKNINEIYYFSEQLKQRLSSMEKYPLTIVEAPSGFGKTTAVREYMRKYLSATSDIYWYTCLGEPPVKAWNNICNLFQNIDHEVAMDLIKLEFPTLETLADMVLLLRKIHCGKETFLVIDNYQLVASDMQRQIMNAFSVHGDERLHIIFITQQLKGQVEATTHYANIHTITELDLMFDRKSIGMYFRRAGLSLSDSELDSVHKSTEGWISAIRLQLLNYEQRGVFEHTKDIEQLVKMAVWNKLSEEEKTFFLSICVLDGFTTRQVQIMIQDEIVPEKLLNLLANNSFIRYFPKQDLYSIHSIFQDFLRNRFYHNQSEEFQRNILHRAGQSCAAISDYYPAALFYYKISEFEAILELPFNGVYLNNQKEKDILEFIADMVHTCPDEILRRYPMTVIGFAFHLYMGGCYEPFGKLCGLIASVIGEPIGIDEKELDRIKGEFALLTSFSYYNDIKKMSEKHKTALQYLDSPSTFMIPTTPWTFSNISVLMMFWSKQGELQNELAYMDECIPYYSRLAKGHGTSADTVMRAEALLLQGADAEAEELCHKALYLGRSQKQITLCLCTEHILSRIAMLRGDSEGYQMALDRIRQYSLTYPERFVLRMAELCMATLTLTIGEAEELTEWLYDLESIKKVLYAPAIPYGHILYGKILLIRKQYNELYGLSGLMMNMAAGMNYLLPQVYHLIHLAIANQSQGKQEKAQEYLEKALAIALPDKVYMPFAEHGVELAQLLSSIRKPVSDREGIDAVIALAKRQEKGVKAVRKAIYLSRSLLTPRERDIALLAKERLSAKEIAEALFISESTVRSTLKNIYSKLNIHSKNELSGIQF